MIPLRVTYAYREPAWSCAAIQSVTLEMDPEITTLHQIAGMIGGPLIIGGNPLHNRTVESVEIGVRGERDYTTALTISRPKSAPQHPDHHRAYRENDRGENQ